MLSQRALNRALLARQLLLTRSPHSPLQAVEHLVGLQAQAPQAPYVGLWTRLASFAPQALSDLLAARQVVRVSVMRGTIHLVTAADCGYLRGLTQPVHERSFRSNWAKRLPALDFAKVADDARRLLERQPMTFDQLGKALAGDWPGCDPAALAQVARTWLTLVQPPPRGLWRTSGAARHTTAEAWFGESAPSSPEPEPMVLRYVGAFGPASVLDLQAWSGLTRLGEVVSRLRPQLVTFFDESGRELFDLPAAPRPPADTPAPVRFLPEFDNALLSHADRARILGDEARLALQTSNGQSPGTVLVDGFVRATWRLTPAALTVRPIGRPLSKRDASAVTAEGRRLLAFGSARSDAEILLVS